MKANQPITVKDNRYDRKEMSLKTFIDKQSQIYLHLMISPGCSYVQLSNQVSVSFVIVLMLGLKYN